MNQLNNFPLQQTGPISNKFLNLGLSSFLEAAEWVAQLPFRRNANKNDPFVLFSEACGTCSTKHILLKELAMEQGNEDIRLLVGIYRMSAANTPGLADLLQNGETSYLPEAHVYLRQEGRLYDFTLARVFIENLEEHLMLEKEISPDWCRTKKVSFHQDFLKTWAMKSGIKRSNSQLWELREECIHRISQHLS